MQEEQAQKIMSQPRFNGIFENGGGFSRRIKLTSSFGADATGYVKRAMNARAAKDITSRLERELAAYIGAPFTVATSGAAAAMHIALKLAARKAYGTEELSGKRVFCSDLCPAEQAMPILYENAVPAFIDVNDADFNMDPEALERAFDLYPDTSIVVMNHLYGFPGNVLEIKRICEKQGAILIENASEAFGAKVDGKPVGTVGDVGVFGFGRDKIISSDSGGALTTKDKEDMEIIRSWIDMPKGNLPWNQYNCVSYDYRMGDLTAAVILDQLPNIDEFINRKKQIFENYLEGLNDDLIYLACSDEDAEPNFWLPVVMCDSAVNAKEVRSENGYSYEDIHGTSSPMEIIDALDAFGADAAPLYMPMSMQPVFKDCELISADGEVSFEEPYGESDRFFTSDVSRDAFRRCLCLPSDIDMTFEEQHRIIEIVNSCFSAQGTDREMDEAVMMACGM